MKDKRTWQKVLLNSAWGGVTGAIYGNWINDSLGRNLALNVGAGAVGGGLIGGLVGGGLGAFNNEAGKGLLWGAGIGVVGGGTLGLLSGGIDHLIRTAMPFSPMVNGAILGAASGPLTILAESVIEAFQNRKKEAPKEEPPKA